MDYESFQRKDKSAIVVIKKRNIPNRPYPNEMIHVDNCRYKVLKIEAQGEALKFTLKFVSGHRFKFKQWLMKHKENVYIQIANSQKFSGSMMTEKRFDFFQEKYKYLMDKEVAKKQVVDGVVRLWLD